MNRKTLENDVEDEPVKPQRRASSAGRRAYDGESHDNTKLYLSVATIITTILGSNGIVDFRAAERGEKITQSNNDMLKHIVEFQDRTAPIVTHLDELATECTLARRKPKPKKVIEEDPDGE
jgi:hypothetical protein